MALQPIKYGWYAVAGLVITGTLVYVNWDAPRWHIKPVDVIELALAVQERCMATQTAPGVYAVAPPSVVEYGYTNTFTWLESQKLMRKLDEKIYALIPHYYQDDWATRWTVTGLFAALNIGNGTNFTALPAIGTNAATYGDIPYQMFSIHYKERYKVLWALRNISNEYCKVSNDVIYIWYDAPLSVAGAWTGGVEKGFTWGWGAGDWTSTKSDVENTWDAFPPATNTGAPYQLNQVAYSKALNYYNGTVGHRGPASFRVGPFPTNNPELVYHLVVSARCVRCASGSNEFVGAWGAENEWVTLLDGESQDEYQQTEAKGSDGTVFPDWPIGGTDPTNFPDITFSAGYATEWGWRAWWTNYMGWHTNYFNLWNLTVFGFNTNCRFYFATDKYW